MPFERHPLHDQASCPVHAKTKIMSKPGSRKDGSPSIWCAVQGAGEGFNDKGYCAHKVVMTGQAAATSQQGSRPGIDEMAKQRGIAMAVALKAGVELALGATELGFETRLSSAIYAAKRAYNELLIPALEGRLQPEDPENLGF